MLGTDRRSGDGVIARRDLTILPSQDPRYTCMNLHISLYNHVWYGGCWCLSRFASQSSCESSLG